MMATSSSRKVAILMISRNNFALKQRIRQLKVKYSQIYAKSNAKNWFYQRRRCQGKSQITLCIQINRPCQLNLTQVAHSRVKRAF